MVNRVLVEGAEDEIRIVCNVGEAVNVGAIHNKGSDPVEYKILYIDTHGNELALADGVLGKDESANVPSPNPASATFGLVANEKIILQTEKDDLVFTPDKIHVDKSCVSPRVRIGPGRTVVAAPPPGKMWQVPVTSFYPCGASFVLFNNDPVDHTVDCLLVGEDGNEVVLTAEDHVPAKSVGNIFSDTFFSHMFPHPYRLEVQITDNYSVENVYVASLFAEFDLPNEDI